MRQRSFNHIGYCWRMKCEGCGRVWLLPYLRYDFSVSVESIDSTRRRTSFQGQSVSWPRFKVGASRRRVGSVMCLRRFAASVMKPFFFYFNVFTPHSGSWLLFLCRMLLAALKTSVVNNNCFEEENKISDLERALSVNRQWMFLEKMS